MLLHNPCSRGLFCTTCAGCASQRALCCPTRMPLFASMPWRSNSASVTFIGLTLTLASLSLPVMPTPSLRAVNVDTDLLPKAQTREDSWLRNPCHVRDSKAEMTQVAP